MRQIINWKEVFRREDEPPETFAQERLTAAYRLVREVARVKGLVAPKELLMDSEAVQVYWMEPVDFLEPYPRGNPIIRRREISLYPPPREARDQLARWIEAFSIAEDRLGFQKNIHAQRGIYKLLHPLWLHQLFPDPAEIMTYEKLLIYENLHLQIENGILRSISRLRDEKGFSAKEAENLNQLARSYAPKLTETDLEEQKAVMVLRIEEIIRRLKDEGDTRGELSAMKLLTFVQQLHHVQTDDTLKKMIEVVATTSHKLSEMKRPKPLPMPQGELNDRQENSRLVPTEHGA